MGRMGKDDLRQDFTMRFTGRADAYSRYRPKYPDKVLGILNSEIGFDRGKTVADVGSGTGILSELFLKNENICVYGIEPNEDMRLVAEANLSKRFPSSFRSVNGTAERTTLPGGSVDLISAGQAFHWFDLQSSRREFLRILRPEGHVCVLYNDRAEDEGIMTEYNRITEPYSRNMASVRDVDDALMSEFFSGYKKFTIPNSQVLNFRGFVGRVLSASYSPPPGDLAGRATLRNNLREAFLKHAKDGTVTLTYTTRLYVGGLGERSKASGTRPRIARREQKK
jgi:ubiquinone/menaquinone biosynthesis C-methylase UbiE